MILVNLSLIDCFLSPAGGIDIYGVSALSCVAKWVGWLGKGRPKPSITDNEQESSISKDLDRQATV